MEKTGVFLNKKNPTWIHCNKKDDFIVIQLLPSGKFIAVTSWSKDEVFENLNFIKIAELLNFLNKMEMEEEISLGDENNGI